jgi:hypothetical protein
VDLVNDLGSLAVTCASSAIGILSSIGFKVQGSRRDSEKKFITVCVYNLDGLVKSLLGRLPGESRGPERLEITGFRLSPE